METLLNKAKAARIVTYKGVSFTIPKAGETAPGVLEVDDAIAEAVSNHKVVAGWIEAGTFAVRGGRPRSEAKPPEGSEGGKPKGSAAK